jgi:hypothetical protein
VGKSKGPKTPNYQALAREEGVQSRLTAGFNTNLNRANQYGPQGSTTWTLRPGADPNNPQPGDYVQRTAADPNTQSIYDQTGGLAARLSGGLAGTYGQGFNPSGLPALGYGQGMQTSLSTSGLPDLTSGYADQRKSVEDAILSRMNPQLDQQEDRVTNQLLNSGVEKGSAGWESEMRRLDQQRNDASSQAVLAGGQEQSRLAALESQIRGQMFGEREAAGAFGNNSILARDQLGNAARGQSFQEQSFQRGLPLQELLALRQAGQLQTPQFSPYYQAGAAQTPGILDAGMAQGQAAQQKFQTQQQGQNALMGGLAGMGSAAIMAGMFSDERLKENIRTVGWHHAGVRRVIWDWKDGSGTEGGVIAQELQKVKPEAVWEGPDGYLRVNYSMIGGR